MQREGRAGHSGFTCGIGHASSGSNWIAVRYAAGGLQTPPLRRPADATSPAVGTRGQTPNRPGARGSGAVREFS